MTTARWLVPEVVQTSAMDCGPAALKCLLGGFGIHVSYGRLREACQTGVDGTSIDTLEDLAVQLGLDAEQVMIPVDHLLIPAVTTLPAIVVVRLPSGVTHFVVAWRRHGRLLQLMDPGSGRRWTTTADFLRETYVHSMALPADAWRDWAGSDEFAAAIRWRLGQLGAGKQADRWLEQAADDPSWRGLALLDAAVRMVHLLEEAGGVQAGAEAARLIDACLRRVREGEPDAVPELYWSARATAPAEDGSEQVMVRGAVLVRAAGVRAADAVDERPPLPPELVAALGEPAPRPGRQLWQLMRQDGVVSAAAVATALVLSAVGVLIEALALRGLVDLSRDLGVASQRLVALLALALLSLALLFFELPVAGLLLRMGRALETRLRVAFLEKLPRLHDRYFSSRLHSDMAERSHAIHALRQLPALAGQLLRATFSLVWTVAAIAWLDPESAPRAAIVAVVALGSSYLAQKLLAERDLRLRTHAGSLSRFYLDALLGLSAVRAHGAERAIRREHEGLLTDWGRAGFSLQRAVVAVEALLLSAGFGASAWLVISFLSRGGELSSVLLLVYWSLALVGHGQQVTQVARQYPGVRNRVLRLLEPLGAPEEAQASEATVAASDGPASVRLEGVAVVAGGNSILAGVDLAFAAGTHTAIVGRSGAGKSSLVGLLLGWHKPAAGQVLVDGVPLGGAELDALRERTVWLDPQVQLWNRSLFENLRYGAAADDPLAVGQVLTASELAGVVERLPEGMQTQLGEGGGLLSGGEGQRVRFGRALLRRRPRLVILDEPFRALDRPRRRELLQRARAWWKDATLICITHDVDETVGFDRVLVIEDGRVVEDDSPAALRAREGSRYRALLEADDKVRTGLWRSRAWRRLRLIAGSLREGDEP